MSAKADFADTADQPGSESLCIVDGMLTVRQTAPAGIQSVSQIPPMIQLGARRSDELLLADVPAGTLMLDDPAIRPTVDQQVFYN